MSPIDHSHVQLVLYGSLFLFRGDVTVKNMFNSLKPSKQKCQLCGSTVFHHLGWKSEIHSLEDLFTWSFNSEYLKKEDIKSNRAFEICVCIEATCKHKMEMEPFSKGCFINVTHFNSYPMTHFIIESCNTVHIYSDSFICTVMFGQSPHRLGKDNARGLMQTLPSPESPDTARAFALP